MLNSLHSDIRGAPRKTPSVLLVDDEQPMLRTLRRMIQPEGYDVRDACDAATFSTELEGQPEVILLDLQLGDLSGVELMREVREASPDSEVIMMTGYATIDSVVESMRAGAFDYLEKPFSDAHRVVRTLERALERRNLRVRNRELEGELGLRSALDGIVVQSAAMRRIVQKVVDLSRNESTVLIEAASGTGKELIARAIHETSLRRDGPFVPVDCGALPEGIAEGELFGYIRGAFTGALRDAPGLFRSANGGTLFLDEIGELPIHLQAKLLRAIQEREVKPLGMETAQSIDVRIVAATNRDLTGEVAAGRFRSDLFYRLRVVSIQLPPLCERPEDIPVLAAHFMDRFSEGSRVSGIDPEALESLLGHSWPGNVRELENTIEAAMALGRGPRLTVADLGLQNLAGRRVASPEGIELSLQAYECACLREAMRQGDENVRRAASLLGIGRSTFYRKLRAHGMKG
jgi:two-component system response regulator HydG